jgi:hypothetical protein
MTGQTVDSASRQKGRHMALTLQKSWQIQNWSRAYERANKITTSSIVNDIDAVFEGFVLLSNVVIDGEMFELRVMSSQNLFVGCPET